MAAIQWRISFILGIIWALTILYNETGIFWISKWSCPWPPTPVDTETRGADSNIGISKIAFISDPQVSVTSSSQSGLYHFASSISSFFVNLYMRRAFQKSVLSLSPDYLFVLGDNLQQGDTLSEEEWFDAARRYQHVFDERGHRFSGRIRDGSHGPGLLASVTEIPGNRDVGYSNALHQKPAVLARYLTVFGSLSEEETVGSVHVADSVDIDGVNFLILNGQALDGNPNDNSTKAIWKFLNLVATTSGTEQAPRIVLSHIPLEPSKSFSCQSGTMPPKRIWYTKTGRVREQNYLSRNTTRRIVNQISPIKLISGHIHANCKWNVSGPLHTVEQVTVGSFNPTFGRPSLLLLRMTTFGLISDPVITAASCQLPSLRAIQWGYCALLAITILALFCWPSNTAIDIFGFFELASAIRKFRSQSSKVKGDDDVEVKVQFDAEGNMYYISVPIEKSGKSAQTSEGPCKEAPSLVRRSVLQDTESGEVLDVPSSVGNKKGRSRTMGQIVVRRLVGGTGPLLVLFVVEMMIYLGFVSNDWM